MAAWKLGNKTFTNPTGYVGFVYLITNLSNNKQYVGMKLFTKAGYKQVKGKRKKLRVANDWKDYYGSNEALQSDVKRLGRNKFRREIIRLCKSKSECKYYEALTILQERALLSDEFYNEWLSIKITKRHCMSFR